MKRFGLWMLLAAVVLLGAGSVAVASRHDDEKGGAKTKLDGYQEVVGPGSISTIGKGELKLKIEDSQISYTLTYTLENPATVAHIHFAQRHVGGGVIAFLCGGGTKPPCPPGVGSPATVSGVITPADILGPASQGIEPGSFDEAVRAIRAGATYANVHSTRWPNGEIRGQIGKRGKE